MLAAEDAAIAARRTLYDIDPAGTRVGLALSGGGVRSATFSLGLLRGLGALGLLQRVDYLSTVSGGGYAGAFYCALFAPRGPQPAVIDAAAAAPGADLLGGDDARAALAYLRQSGRYLTPGGGRDYFYAAALLVRNWMALTLVTGIAILFVELLQDGVRSILDRAIGVAARIFPCAASLDGLLPWYWVSPLVLLVGPVLVVIAASYWAYWLTISDVGGSARPWSPLALLLRPPLLGSLVVTGVCLFLVLTSGLPQSPPGWIPALLLAISTLALGFLVVANRLEPCATAECQEAHQVAMKQDRVRNRLSRWQAGLAIWLALLVVLSVVDSASFLFIELYRLMGAMGKWTLALPPAFVALVPFGQKLIKFLAMLPERQVGGPNGGPAAEGPGLMARLGPALAALASLIFALTAIGVWGGLAHLLAWQGAGGQGAGGQGMDGIPHGYVLSGYYPHAVGGAGLFVAFAAFSYGFVNLSTLASFYADRLCRAYLGAGNRARLSGTPGKPPRADHQTIAGDDIGLEDYYEHARGAPVHLINVTINETHGKGLATVQRDRHGLNLVVSPGGMGWSESPDRFVIKPLGARQHAAWAEASGAGTGLQPGQSLPLSMWIGISGAAFTTGLGAQTSLVKSALAFFANVRLGYWWGCNRQVRMPGITYGRLFSELAASFPGTTSKQWYLSDGGHFENTAVYELLRRRLPFVLVTDNGCDPAYGFEDVANLVRKARIDFGAEITFLDDAALDAALGATLAGGSLRALFAPPAGFVGEHASPHAIAMLGRIAYADAPPGTLLLVKPRLGDDGPADLMRYKTDNRTFPQQTTLDQFFDEAQWESYYELGRLMAKALFARREGAGWQPCQFAALPA